MEDFQTSRDTSTTVALPDAKAPIDAARMASATFDFSHHSNLSVHHPVSPVTDRLSQRGRERVQDQTHRGFKRPINGETTS